MRKLTVAFEERVFRELDKDAKNRNITLQALLRALVIPEWIKGRSTKTAGSGEQSRDIVRVRSAGVSYRVNTL